MQSVGTSREVQPVTESAAPAPRRTHPGLWIPSLYFAEGVPMITVSVVAALMYKNLGISNTDIALYTGMFYVPWTFKPLWAPITEMFKTKRHWVLGTQFAMAVALACVALCVPLPSFMGLTLAFFWVTAFLSSTHDIAADGFSRGQCSAVVPAPSLPAATSGPAAASSPAPPGKTNVTLVEVDCPLTPLPKSTVVSGQLMAAADKRPISGATLKLIDAEGHEASATSDANGMFRFENVDPGHPTLRVEADGYLPREQPRDIPVGFASLRRVRDNGPETLI